MTKLDGRLLKPTQANRITQTTDLTIASTANLTLACPLRSKGLILEPASGTSASLRITVVIGGAVSSGTYIDESRIDAGEKLSYLNTIQLPYSMEKLYSSKPISKSVSPLLLEGILVCHLISLNYKFY